MENPKIAADHLVRQWAQSSGDHETASIAVQMMAAKEFGLSNAANPAKVYGHDEAEVESYIGRAGNRIPQYLQAVYANTQEHLAKAGVTEITLYRGMHHIELEKRGTVRMNPLSSFSTSQESAMNFGKVVIKVKVPASQVFSTSISGPGCYNEAEMVVLGGEVPYERV